VTLDNQLPFENQCIFRCFFDADISYNLFIKPEIITLFEKRVLQLFKNRLGLLRGHLQPLGVFRVMSSFEGSCNSEEPLRAANMNRSTTPKGSTIYPLLCHVIL
jgi:hypothetical protein